MINNVVCFIPTLGSNTHNNNPPGGDGQTGDDGEGTTGKTNVLALSEFNISNKQDCQMLRNVLSVI